MPQQSEANCPKVRARFKKDGEWLRKFRHCYIRRARPWIEADKNRIDEAAEKLLKLGAYAGRPECPSARRCVRYAILRLFCRDDGALDQRFGWHRWTEKNGWQSYHWLPVTLPVTKTG